MSDSDPLSEILRYLKAAEPQTPEQYYLILLQLVLTRFQLLEEGLKQYLLDVHFAIEEGVKSKFAYDSLGAINQSRDFPLKRLLAEFLRYGGNPDLARRIKGLIPARNEVAHTGYIWLYDHERKPVTLEERLEKLRKTASELEGLPSAVFDESLKFRNLPKKSELPEPLDPDDGGTPPQAGLSP